MKQRPDVQQADVPIGALQASPWNQAREDNLEQLQASIKEHGVLQPIVVRKATDKDAEDGSTLHYLEIVCGHRRVAAVKGLGRASIPAVVHESMDDEAARLAQIVENVQREDLDPIQEAELYFGYVESCGASPNQLAARLGKDPKHIHECLMLRCLIPPAKKLLRDKVIGMRHAVCIALMKPEDQKRCIDPEEQGLFRRTLIVTEEEVVRKDKLMGYAPVTVTELKRWIEDRVRFRAEQADPIFTPEAMPAKEAGQSKEPVKVVQITYESQVHPDARDGEERTYTPATWKLADGSKGHKKCNHAVLGLVVVGPDRTKSFPVCIAKKKCKVHWGEEIKASAKKEKAGPEGPSPKEQADQEKRRREEQRQQAIRLAYEHCLPELFPKVMAKLRTAKVTGGSPLGRLVAHQCQPSWLEPRFRKALNAAVKPGKSPESLLRYVAACFLAGLAQNSYHGVQNFGPYARALGIDLPGIVKDEAEKLLAKAAMEAEAK